MPCETTSYNFVTTLRSTVSVQDRLDLKRDIYCLKKNLMISGTARLEAGRNTSLRLLALDCGLAERRAHTGKKFLKLRFTKLQSYTELCLQPVKKKYDTGGGLWNWHSKGFLTQNLSFILNSVVQFK